MNFWSRLMTVFAIELERLEERVYDMLNEGIPGLSVEMLPEWERMLGLPDDCFPVTPSVTERQRIAHAKYTANYTTANAVFFIDYAAALGSSLSVGIFAPGNIFRVDINRVTRTPPLDIDGSRLGSIAFHARIKFTLSSTDPNKDYLRCYFDKIAPAHVRIIWEYI